MWTLIIKGIMEILKNVKTIEYIHAIDFPKFHPMSPIVSPSSLTDTNQNQYVAYLTRISYV